VCDRLTPDQATVLFRTGERALAAVNHSVGPATVLG